MTISKVSNWEKFKAIAPIILNIVEDWSALLVAMGVDFAFNYVFFSFVAVDDVTKNGFNAIVFLMVFFKVRSLKKSIENKKDKSFKETLKGIKKISILWIIFALVTSFCGVSFALFDIQYQSDNLGLKDRLILAAKTDSELIRMDTDIKEKKAVEKDYADQFRLAQKQETMNSIKPFWDSAMLDRQKAESDRDTYYKKITDPGRPRVKASEIFFAIPRAIEKGNLIQVIIFTMIFLGLEASIFTAVSETNSSKIRRRIERESIIDVQDISESPKTDLQDVAPSPVLTAVPQIDKTAQPAPEAPAKRTRGPYITQRIRDQIGQPVKVEASSISTTDKARSLVESWVTFSWYNVRNKKFDDKGNQIMTIIPKKQLLDFCQKKEIDIDESRYDKLLECAILLEIVSNDGYILETDRPLAIDKIFDLVGNGLVN